VGGVFNFFYGSLNIHGEFGAEIYIFIHESLGNIYFSKNDFWSKKKKIKLIFGVKKIKLILE
jgi:hypothetical protein